MHSGEAGIDGQMPDAALVRQGLTDAGFESSDLHLFAQLDSTSLWLRERADKLFGDDRKAQVTAAPIVLGQSALGSVPAQLCATHWQSSGIARRGRNWQTKPGNITFSLLTQTPLKPNELLGLSLVTGIGVATCLAKECNLNPQLKWPNDVMLNGAKIGGLLTELMAVKQSASMAASTRVLTGIGVNYLHDPDVQDLGIGATSLEESGVEVCLRHRDELLGKLAGSVLAAHRQFLSDSWAPFAGRWHAVDWLLGRAVTIHRDDRVEQAIARGVNEQGALLVEQNGQIGTVIGGEVSIRPIK